MHPIDRLRTFGNSPAKIAIILAVLLLAWLVIIGDFKRAETLAPEKSQSSESENFAVEVRTSVADKVAPRIVVNGQVAPWRNVKLKAEVSGRVVATLKNQGDAVATGETVLTLTDEGRTAQHKRAKADVKYRQLELQSAKKLKTSQFVSEAELSRLESELANAEASLESASLALDKAKPSAPFSGIIDRRYVEVGDQVSNGEDLIDLVQIDKLKVTAQVSQQKVAKLELGQSASLRLLDSSSLEGKLSFISAVADPDTRSYLIEIEVDNPERRRIAGASVEVSLAQPSAATHTLSPALLALNSAGKLGVYTVSDADVVEYYPVQLVSISDQAIVTGLPQTARIITNGAGFVNVGDKVKTVEIGATSETDESTL